jgi:hypothetical protein
MQTNWEKLPLGKRKVEFVKWLMKKHKVRLEDAKLACYKKFYKEEQREMRQAYRGRQTQRFGEKINKRGLLRVSTEEGH